MTHAAATRKSSPNDTTRKEGWKAMKHRTLSLVLVICAVLLLVPAARADTDSARHYYLSLGDALAASFQPNGDLTHGYAEQLHAALAAEDPKLELVKLGCGGESTASMRFGSQYPSVVQSCGTPRYYKNVLYPKGTQLAEAVNFLQAHKDNVALVTIDIGANDLSRLDAQGNVVTCLFEPAGCAAQVATMAQNLAAILAELKAAAGPVVPIVGMTYYDVFAPLCVSDASLLFVCGRVDAVNGLLATTYAASGVPVADVAGAFENDVLANAAANVCAWTWFCSLGDVHANAAGYGVIAQAFADVLPCGREHGESATDDEGGGTCVTRQRSRTSSASR
jgi:lysophospholipase L1-like esterase